jgi:hypothetical protein
MLIVKILIMFEIFPKRDIPSKAKNIIIIDDLITVLKTDK